MPDDAQPWAVSMKSSGGSAWNNCSMNTDEATAIVRQELTKLRARPYAALVALIGNNPPTIVVTGASGGEYQIEIQALWDVDPGGDVRVIGSIDDGGWRAFLPLSQDFVAHPNGVTSATW
jgi:hypothetical protein